MLSMKSFSTRMSSLLFYLIMITATLQGMPLKPEYTLKMFQKDFSLQLEFSTIIALFQFHQQVLIATK